MSQWNPTAPEGALQSGWQVHPSLWGRTRALYAAIPRLHPWLDRDPLLFDRFGVGQGFATHALKERHRVVATRRRIDIGFPLLSEGRHRCRGGSYSASPT